VLKELKKHSKKTKANTPGRIGCLDRKYEEPRIEQVLKLEIIQDGATLIKHLGNPFGSTWIQKLITTKLIQKDLEHHLRCQAQDIELGVLEKREHSQA